MSGQWWDRYPARLEKELNALKAAGIQFARNEAEFRQGKLCLTLSHTVDGRQVTLDAIYPSSYPFFPFQVYAPGLTLQHHQNPFRKNLCLLGRSTSNWMTTELLADFIVTLLPQVLLAGDTSDRAVAAPLEEHQAEPFTDYIPYLVQDGMILIDGAWKLDSAIRGGRFIVAIDELVPSFAKVLEVLSPEGKPVLAANPALAKNLLGKRRAYGQWARLEQPINSQRPIDWLMAITTALTPLGRLKGPQAVADSHGRKFEFFAAVFPEESAWRRESDGWLFVFNQSFLRPKVQKSTKFIRTGRAGPSDLAWRIPTLTPLATKHIAHFGLGAIGATSALEFARCGIGQLNIMDGDFVEPGTIVRWPIGLRAAGGDKSVTIAQQIGADYPYTKVSFVTYRIGLPTDKGQPQDNEIQRLVEFTTGADLIFDATAELAVQRIVSTIAKEKAVPYISAATTMGAWGGQIVRIRPGTTEGCWACLRWSQDDGTIPKPIEDPKGSVQPAGCSDPTFTGAAFDIAEVTMAAVRLAVATLCKGFQNAYPDFDWDVANVALRDPDGKPILPSWSYYRLRRHPSCSCSK